MKKRKMKFVPQFAPHVVYLYYMMIMVQQNFPNSMGKSVVT